MKLFQTVDPEFIRENFKDPKLAERIIQADQRKVTIMKVVVGSFLLVTMVAIGYAINKQNVARDFKVQTLNVVSKADSCQLLAKQQVSIEENARLQANERHMKIQQQLEECQKKTSKK